ncbi:MAG: SH3 domain-containing protein, partial [Candidatus Omnitrophica bacterium]|nr:SH3 domain-containing protein [Candidatus Omnitrophota bacterium]
AVVVIEYSDCKFEPFDDATTHFTLYEGESVITGTQKGEWIKIKRLDGKQGWIKQRDIEFL